MTDWKMPEWMREIWKGTGWHKHAIDISTAEKWRSECQAHQTPNLESQMLGAILVMENLRPHNLISTPSERDEQEKRAENEKQIRIKYQDIVYAACIALDAVGDINWCAIGAVTERIDLLKKQIATLKSALDNAEKENNAAWVLNEKLKGEADRLNPVCPECGNKIPIRISGLIDTFGKDVLNEYKCGKCGYCFIRKECDCNRRKEGR